MYVGMRYVDSASLIVTACIKSV